METRQEHDELVSRKLQAEMTRDKDGRYCVKLPFVSTEVPLLSNLIVAEKRLVKATEKMRKKIFTGNMTKFSRTGRQKASLKK